MSTTSDVTKFAFKFNNVRTSNVFGRFEIHRIFSRTRRRIWTSGLHDRHHTSTPTGHRNNQLNKCALPNSLKGPRITLDMADHHVNKDGLFRILGNALTYLLLDFFGITFLHFYHRHVNVWLNSHSYSNGFVLWNSHSMNAKFSWLHHITKYNHITVHTRTQHGWLNLSHLSTLPAPVTVKHRVVRLL